MSTPLDLPTSQIASDPKIYTLQYNIDRAEVGLASLAKAYTLTWNAQITNVNAGSGVYSVTEGQDFPRGDGER